MNNVIKLNIFGHDVAKLKPASDLIILTCDVT